MWAQVRSFNCDMYWPLLNTYWKSFGFGLGGLHIGAALLNKEGISVLGPILYHKLEVEAASSQG